MKQNITELLRQVRAITWAEEDSRDALNVVLEYAGVGAIFDWDQGAGEFWSQVNHESRVVAYVCMANPLAVLEIGLQAAVAPLESIGVRTLLVPDMDAQCLSVDAQALAEWVGRPISKEIDPSMMSMNDLWWATV